MVAFEQVVTDIFPVAGNVEDHFLGQLIALEVGQQARQTFDPGRNLRAQVVGSRIEVDEDEPHYDFDFQRVQVDFGFIETTDGFAMRRRPQLSATVVGPGMVGAGNQLRLERTARLGQ